MSVFSQDRSRGLLLFLLRGTCGLIILSVLVMTVHAASFNDATNGNWNDGATWGNDSPGSEGTDFPGPGDTVTINSNTVTLSADQSADDITISTGGTFTVGNHGSTITVEGTWINSSGIFTAGTGTVLLTSTGSETLTGGSSIFNNLTIDNGLLAYWKFDEGIEDVTKDSSRNGSNNGMRISMEQSDWEAGNNENLGFFNNYSLSFDGVDEHVDIGKALLSTSDGSQPYTFSVWIKTSTTDTFDSIVSQYISGNGTRWGLFIHSTKIIWTKGASIQATSSTAVNTDTWRHIAATRAGNGTVQLYVDGSPDGSAGTDSNAFCSCDFQIGALDGTTDFNFPGEIDDVRVYTRALSASEIEALANGNPSSSSGTYTLGSQLELSGSLLNYTGTVDVSASDHPITVSGSWLNHGDFTKQSGTVYLPGGGAQTMSGNTVFNNLTITDNGATRTIFMDWTSRQTVSGALALQGTESNTLSVRSTRTGSAAQLVLDAETGTQTVAYVDVQDSNAGSGTSIICYENLEGCTDSENNTNWVFVDTDPPTISTLSPTDGATSVALDSNLVITFNETIDDTGTGTITIKKSSDDSTVELITVTGSLVTGSGSAEITINPTDDLEESTSYYINISQNAFPDASGNSFAGISDTTTWNFTTVGVAPTISTLSPTDDATDVAVNTDLEITFNEVIDKTGTGTITIKKSSDDSTVETITVTGSLVTGSGSTDITINPTDDLANSTSYYINISQNAFPDASGNSFAGISDTTTWNFTTVAASSSSDDSSSTTVSTGGGGSGGGRGSPEQMAARIAQAHEIILARFSGDQETLQLLVQQDHNVPTQEEQERIVDESLLKLADARRQERLDELEQEEQLQIALLQELEQEQERIADSEEERKQQRLDELEQEEQQEQERLAEIQEEMEQLRNERQQERLLALTQEPTHAAADAVDSTLAMRAQRNNVLLALVDQRHIVYSDVVTTEWYAPYVSAVISEGIAEGYRELDGSLKGEFGVANPVTLAESVKMALESAAKNDGMSMRLAPENTSARDTWASQYIRRAEDLNLEVFASSPNVHRDATRGEVIQILMDVFELPTKGARFINVFSDLGADHEYAAAIELAYFYGVVSGDTDADGNPQGTIRPDDPINRAEVAKMVSILHTLLD